MDADIKVSGTEEAIATINKIKKDFPNKVIAAGMRKASKPYANKLKQDAPGSDMRGVVKTKVYSKKTESPTVTTGLFGKKSASKTPENRRPSPYMTAYWVNYGTLLNRFTGHRFLRARRPKSLNWRGGITPRQFVEKAWEATKSAVISAMPVEMTKEAEKYIEKEAKKNAAKS